jgi:hypothetical protein
MTTTSLDLSRQLQERWPEWETEKYWFLDDSHHSTHPEWDEWMLTDNETDAWDRHNIIAPTLEELRVFALELIGLNPKYDGIDKQHMTAKLAVVLIKGCDPTAEWIIETFGEK